MKDREPEEHGHSKLIKDPAHGCEWPRVYVHNPIDARRWFDVVRGQQEDWWDIPAALADGRDGCDKSRVVVVASVAVPAFRCVKTAANEMSCVSVDEPVQRVPWNSMTRVSNQKADGGLCCLGHRKYVVTQRKARSHMSCRSPHRSTRRIGKLKHILPPVSPLSSRYQLPMRLP